MHEWAPAGDDTACALPHTHTQTQMPASAQAHTHTHMRACLHTHRPTQIQDGNTQHCRAILCASAYWHVSLLKLARAYRAAEHSAACEAFRKDVPRIMPAWLWLEAPHCHDIDVLVATALDAAWAA